MHLLVSDLMSAEINSLVEKEVLKNIIFKL